MGIGASIFLIAIGLIMALAVGDAEVLGLNLNIVGFILAACGVLGLIITLVIFAPRRRSVTDNYAQQGQPSQPARQQGQYPPNSY